MQDKANSLFKQKVLLIVLLTFANFADLAVLLIMGKGFFGIFKFFFIYGLVFMLQDAFTWFRYALIVLFLATTLLNVGSILSNTTAVGLPEFLLDKLFVPAALPFFVSMACIALLSFLFLRKYKMFN